MTDTQNGWHRNIGHCLTLHTVPLLKRPMDPHCMTFTKFGLNTLKCCRGIASHLHDLYWICWCAIQRTVWSIKKLLVTFCHHSLKVTGDNNQKNKIKKRFFVWVYQIAGPFFMMEHNIIGSFCEYIQLVSKSVIFYISKNLQTSLSMDQTGLIKIRTFVHFLCNTVLHSLLHVSPQFQREMSTEWR